MSGGASSAPPRGARPGWPRRSRWYPSGSRRARRARRRTRSRRRGPRPDDARRGREARRATAARGTGRKKRGARSLAARLRHLRRDASSRRVVIRPSDAFESPDRPATRAFRNATDETPRAPRRAFSISSARALGNPYAPSWPWWLTEHGATPSPRCAPASSPPTVARAFGTCHVRRRPCARLRPRSAGHEVALKKIRAAEDGRRHAPPGHLPRLHRVCGAEASKRGRAPDVVVARSAPRAEDKASCVVYLSFEFVEHDLAGLLSATDVARMRPGQMKRVVLQLFSALAKTVTSVGCCTATSRGVICWWTTTGRQARGFRSRDSSPARRSRAAHERRRDAVVSSSRALTRRHEIRRGRGHVERGVSAGGALARQTGVSGQTEVEQLQRLPDVRQRGRGGVAERLGGYTIGAPRPDVPASTPGTFRGIAECRRPPRVGPRRRVTLARSEGSRISGGGDAKPVLHRRARPGAPLPRAHAQQPRVHGATQHLEAGPRACPGRADSSSTRATTSEVTTRHPRYTLNPRAFAPAT